jgi:hypothetical protein
VDRGAPPAHPGGRRVIERPSAARNPPTAGVATTARSPQRHATHRVHRPGGPGSKHTVWPARTGEESSTGPYVPNDHCSAPVIASTANSQITAADVHRPGTRGRGGTDGAARRQRPPLPPGRHLHHVDVPVATADEDGVAVHPGSRDDAALRREHPDDGPVARRDTGQHGPTPGRQFESPSDTDVNSHGSTAAGMTTTTPPSASWPHP